MNKEGIERCKAWNDFKNRFPKICQEIDALQEKIEKNIVCHSLDFDNIKKSQVVISFVEKPINVYKNKTGNLEVETQWGCRIIYQLEYNGSVCVKVKNYSGDDFMIKKYSSASKISKRSIRSHIKKFFLIEVNGDVMSQPSLFCKLKYGLFKLNHGKGWVGILKAVLTQIKFIKQIVKAFGCAKKQQ